MALKKLTEKDVEFIIEIEMDHIEVRGNAVVSGDDEFDKKVEDEIIERLNNGDIWAWAAVTIKAQFGKFEGTDHLGCCSYENEEDFKNDGYYEDMKQLALDDLNRELQEAYNLLKQLNNN